MQRIVYDCDRCGKKDIEPIKISAVVDRQLDGDGSSEDIERAAEICTNCAKKFIESICTNRERSIYIQSKIFDGVRK